MRNFFGILLAFFCLCSSAQASTVISGTLSITNAAALTNATSGQSYTLNGDTRTFTNSVANPATQIRVRTNDSPATILLSLVAQAGAYPFSPIQSMTTSGGTNVTFRATNDTALTITLSPTNWGKLTYSTQTVGTVQTVIRVPMSAEESSVRTNNATQLWSDLDTYSQTRGLAKVDFSGRVEFDAGLGLHGRALVATNYTLTTNDLYLGVDTRSNTNLILTLPTASSASNLLFLIKDEGGAGATNKLKIYPQTGDRIDGLTNLVVSNNFGSVTLRSRGGTNYAVISSGGGVTGGGGGGSSSSTVYGFVSLTNSLATVATTNVATNSLIFLSRMGSGGAVAVNENLASRSLATSFAIVSSGTNDSAYVAWQLVNTGTEVPVLSTNYLAPYAYFRLDTAGTDYMTNEIGALNWVKLISAAISTNAFITNGFFMPGPNNVMYGTNNNFDFADEDFALRFWVKKYGLSDNNFFHDLTTASDLYMIGASTNAIKFIETTDGGSFTNISAYPISTNVFHRVFVWRAGAAIGIKVDDNPRETTAISGVADFNNLRFRNSSSDNVLYDEISVWRGYVPTEAEMRWDWNSGTGRTYPLGP